MMNPSPLQQPDRQRAKIAHRFEVVIAVCAAGSVLLAATGCFSGTRLRNERITLIEQSTTMVVDAENALGAGDEIAALNLLAQAIEVNPTLTVAHIRMAEIHRNRGDLSDSERSYRRAVTIEPRNFVAQLGHAEVLHAVGRVIEAVRAYVRAVSLEPENPAANKGLAAAYLELDEPRAARAHRRSVRRGARRGRTDAEDAATQCRCQYHARSAPQSRPRLCERPPGWCRR